MSLTHPDRHRWRRAGLVASLSLIAVMLAALGVTGATSPAVATPLPPVVGSTTSVTLAKSDYYDKTLAGIVGEIGGFLSGYEFAAPNDQPLPDSWFDPANGPYAGNFTYFTPPGNTADYVRYLAPGRVRGQDNYFMDFFNQRILQEKGIQPSNADIRAEYLKYGISDYGGSGVANNLMNATGMLPFQSGKQEFNNIAWCCEPYIETDTLGFITPGMPQTANALASRFAGVSGESTRGFGPSSWPRSWPRRTSPRMPGSLWRTPPRRCPQTPGRLTYTKMWSPSTIRTRPIGGRHTLC